MNNEQFRRLLDTPSSSSSSDKQTKSSPQNANPAATPSAATLGSKMRSSIPMTPRSLTGNIDFARQLADYRRGETTNPNKRFKSTSAPKGTRLPSGYQDRAAQLRANEETQGGENDDLEKRVKALEEMVKLGQIDQGTFERLTGEMGVGGDVGSTHMVKGLDWKLLRRVRDGEDVEGGDKEVDKEVDKGEGEEVEDVDEAFEKVLEGGGGEGLLPSAPKEKKEKKKKGSMAPPPVPAGKRTRDEILKQLKASRAAAAAAAEAEAEAARPAEPVLGARFKKFGDAKVEKKRWVEEDENGRRREVLQITDAEGKVKRKTRWLDKPGESHGVPVGLLVPDKAAKPLGMEVPAEIAAKVAASAPEEEEDDDIFAGVGADYDPLGDVGDGDSSSGSEDGEVGDKETRASEKKPDQETEKPAPASRPRNYFSTSKNDETAEETDRSNPMATDPTILAALKRAAALRQASPSSEGEDGEEGVDAETLQRRKKFIEEARRREALDAMDMDYGFGGSRNEDEEDDEAVVFEDERGAKKRKRGPKKKKGDKDSVSDVMRVLDGRKKD